MDTFEHYKLGINEALKGISVNEPPPGMTDTSLVEWLKGHTAGLKMAKEMKIPIIEVSDMYQISENYKKINGKEPTERETADLFYKLDSFIIDMARMHDISDTVVRDHIFEEVRDNPLVYC